MYNFWLIINVFLLFPSSETSLKKRISDVNFRYEFYTTDKSVYPEPEKQYYWFKGGAIHNSEFGTAGELLHKEYRKFYHSNQLAEAGKFKNGLKVGLWKAWFENGTIKSNVSWSDGQMDGAFYGYDQNGKLVEYGKYKNGKKHGRWINAISKDTLKYRNGEVVVKKVKLKEPKKNSGKPGLLKRIFTKKNKTVSPNPNPGAQGYKMPAPQGGVKKDNFFKRIFSKKDKTATGVPAVQETKVKSAPAGNPEGNFFKRLFSKKDKNPGN